MKEIEIYNADPSIDLGKEDFNNFLSHYPNLESLEIEGCGLFTDDHLKVIGANLCKLRCLVIRMNSCITDDGISFLAGDDTATQAHCPLLEVLEFRRAKPELEQVVTAVGVRRISCRLHKVQILDLWVNEVHRNILQCLSVMTSLLRVNLRSYEAIHVTEFELMRQAGFAPPNVGVIEGKKFLASEVGWYKEEASTDSKLVK